jgi:hypothetical protein
MTGIVEKTALIRLGLEALIARESARRLATLGGNKKSYEATQRSYDVYLTEFIQLSTCCPWVSETRGSAAGHFSLNSGKERWDSKSGANYGRALPVRPGK